MRTRAAASNSAKRSSEPCKISPPSMENTPVGASGSAAGKAPVSTGTGNSPAAESILRAFS